MIGIAKKIWNFEFLFIHQMATLNVISMYQNIIILYILSIFKFEISFYSPHGDF